MASTSGGRYGGVSPPRGGNKPGDSLPQRSGDGVGGGELIGGVRTAGRGLCGVGGLPCGIGLGERVGGEWGE